MRILFQTSIAEEPYKSVIIDACDDSDDQMFRLMVKPCQYVKCTAMCDHRCL
jgi:hypothetical protein